MADTHAFMTRCCAALLAVHEDLSRPGRGAWPPAEFANDVYVWGLEAARPPPPPPPPPLDLSAFASGQRNSVAAAAAADVAEDDGSKGSKPVTEEARVAIVDELMRQTREHVNAAGEVYFSQPWRTASLTHDSGIVMQIRWTHDVDGAWRHVFSVAFVHIPAELRRQGILMAFVAAVRKERFRWKEKRDNTVWYAFHAVRLETVLSGPLANSLACLPDMWYACIDPPMTWSTRPQ